MHAYVLMTNHVHLLATPKHAGDIPYLMISLGRRYVQYFNKTHRRTGTLWGSRYKSSLIFAGLAGKDNSCSEGYALSCNYRPWLALVRLPQFSIDRCS